MNDFFPVKKEFREVSVGQHFKGNPQTNTDSVDSNIYVRIQEFYCEECFLWVNAKIQKVGSDAYEKFLDDEIVKTMN